MMRNRVWEKYYQNSFKINSTVERIIDNFSKFSGEELSKLATKQFKVAGRVLRNRKFGKLSFCVLGGHLEQLQLLSTEEFNSDHQSFNQLAIGDLIGVRGTLCRTNSGELSLRVSRFIILAKSEELIPDGYFGLEDVELRFRKRYLDFIVNKKSCHTIVTRSSIITSVRDFFNRKGFLEVETPILVSSASGAQAKPFVTYHNKLKKEFNLRIATEINLKKMLVGGFNKVYEIGRVFRNEGIDARHNPEFTTIEVYEAFYDSKRMMRITESLISKLRKKLFAEKTLFSFNGFSVKIDDKFARISMIDSIKKVTGVDFSLIKDLLTAQKVAFEHGISLEKYQQTRGHIITLFFENFVEKTLQQPTFIYDYPIETSPLAKRKKGSRHVADRFELFIGGLEFANGYSELNDPNEQLVRFENQRKESVLGNQETDQLDYEFIDALRYGMPPTGGLGIGIDRLVMLFTEQNNIREVIAFPQLKDKKIS